MDVKYAFGSIILVLALAVGCNESVSQNAQVQGNGSQSNATQQHQTTSNTEPVQAVHHANPAELLVGTWYGRAKLSQEHLSLKLDNTTDVNQRQMLQQLAAAFQTTSIGAQYTADGKMVLDIEIQPGGQVFRDSAVGTWRPIETQENAIVVETIEMLPGGSTETKNIRYQFEQNGDVAVMVAPTNDLLADCHPVFVFQRVNEPTAVANRGNEPTTQH